MKTLRLRRSRLTLLASLLLAAMAAMTVLTPAAWAENRHLAMILDTSGSMMGNDPKRYTVQLAQILGDLLDDSDRLTVVRMPVGAAATCSDGAASRLARSLDPTDRAGFKRQLDALIHYEDGTHFAAPIRTAAAALASDPQAPRMLLIISDDGGLGDCARALTAELLRQKTAGVTIAAINLGANGGAFDTNPAFSFTTAAQNAEQLARAVALVYQKFLGAKQVQTGRVDTAIRLEIAPFVSQAFLVVAADGPVGAVAPAAGNPGAAAIDPDFRGGGETRGLDGLTRGYRIVRLRQPAPGPWSFIAPGLTAGAGWMLIQESSVGLRAISAAAMPRGARGPKGLAVPLALEIYDQSTGRRISHPGSLPGLAITADIDGRKVTFRDDGKNGDPQAGDGVFTAMATFDHGGPHRIPLHLESAFLDRQVTIETDVVDAPGGGPAAPARSPLAVLGRLAFGRPVTVTLGRGSAGATLQGRLDLTAAEVHGEVGITVTSDYDLGRSALEIDAGGGWLPLGAAPQTLRLVPGGRRAWPVRLRIGSCPEGSRRRRFKIRLAGTGTTLAPGPGGRLPDSAVPLALEVVPEPWLRCWWPVVALGLGAAALGVLAYGVWSPSRFSGQLGVVLSPEADMTEGFLHPIRGQRGSRSGLFRDARIYVCHDYRLSGRSRHALARLRADAAQVRIRALPGEAVWRQSADGGWEALPPGESPARYGTVYRNDLGSLYFELRNA